MARLLSIMIALITVFIFFSSSFVRFKDELWKKFHRNLHLKNWRNKFLLEIFHLSLYHKQLMTRNLYKVSRQKKKLRGSHTINHKTRFYFGIKCNVDVWLVMKCDRNFPFEVWKLNIFVTKATKHILGIRKF